MNKTLIAYYSRKGQNYVGGNIKNLPVGNTEVVAKKIHELTGGDLFFIDTVQLYPIDYTATTQVAKDELKANARPELKNRIDNIDEYDTIYLGYPNWWGTFPMAVFTFLESYDFSCKTIIPFCTHEGSGMGHSVGDIRKQFPDSKIEKGIAIRGSSVKSADGIIENWIRGING